MDGCDPLAREGHPEVPACGVLVGVPFGVEPHIRVLERESGGRIGGLRIPPAPVWDVIRDGGFKRLAPGYEYDAEAYGGAGPYPGVWAEEGWTGLFYHDADHPFGLLERDGRRFVCQPVDGEPR